MAKFALWVSVGAIMYLFWKNSQNENPDLQRTGE